MPEKRVLIVGGGLAGLAAASALAVRGARVILCEARPRLGGRASSFTDQATGETIDNCQHVGMGCCTNLQHFCRTVGIAGHFRVERSLTFIGPDGSKTPFAAAPLPAPAHLAPAFARLPYLSMAEKGRLAQAVISLARTPAIRLQGTPFLSWLCEHRQTPRLIECVWDVILVSALSESLDRIDAAYARKVIVDGFLAHRRGWEVHIPTLPWDQLYVEHLLPWLSARNVEVRTLSGVERLTAVGPLITDAVLRSGERLEADEYVLAVPHYRVGSMLPDEAAAADLKERAARIESAPITSVHLWFDAPLTDMPHAVIVGKLSQWLFNKEQIHGGAFGASRYGYQVVISASRHVRGMSRDELVAAVARELKELFPNSSKAAVVSGRVVSEHRAVFSVTPGIDQIRPPQQSVWQNLQLAGDWTQTGWPSTMEGAVRSGYLAAENVLRRIGRPERLVQSDLRVAWGARLLGIGR